MNSRRLAQLSERPTADGREASAFHVNGNTRLHLFGHMLDAADNDGLDGIVLGQTRQDPAPTLHRATPEQG